MATTEELKVLISAKDQASAALKSVRGQFTDLERAAQALLRALGPIAGALAVREIIDSAVSWERYRVALETVTGSQAAANAELEWLAGISDSLGLEIETVAGSYAKLAASAKGTAVEGEATRDIFFAVAGAMAKLGASAADTDGALIAISQMMSKGKVSAEELRQQLGERMPGAFQLFAKAAGVSTAELDAMLQRGEVGIDLLPKFATELKNAFDIDIDTRIDTAQAAMNRFNNSLLELKLTVADAGLLDAFVSGLEGLRGAISDQGLLQNLSLLGAQFSSISDDGQGFENFLNGLVEVFKVFGVGVMTVLAPVKLLGEIIGATAAAISLAVEGDFAAAKAALTDSGPGDKFKADIAKIEAAVANLGSSFREVETAAEPAAKEITTMGDAAALAAAEAEANAKANNRAAAAIEAGGKAAKDAAKASEADAKAKELQSKQAHEAAMKLADLNVEMEKIASQERIASMELMVELNLARLEADTEIAKGIIANVGTAIESTGSLLGSLFGDLTGATRFTDRWLIEDQIKEENRRRDEALDQQKELTEAQVKLLNARADRMKSGDAMITITGDGLAPELEAFMWKILEAIQVRAADEESAFLLGI